MRQHLGFVVIVVTLAFIGGYLIGTHRTRQQFERAGMRVSGNP